MSVMFDRGNIPVTKHVYVWPCGSSDYALYPEGMSKDYERIATGSLEAMFRIIVEHQLKLQSEISRL